MAKFLIFSDIHAHNYQEFSTLVDGINSRLLETLFCLQRIRNCAIEEKADAILFGGDLYNSKNFLDSGVIKFASSGMLDIASVAPIVFVYGNHDYRSWDKNPDLVELLGSYSSSITAESCEICGWKIFVFPFARDVSQTNSEIGRMDRVSNSIALLHNDVVGQRYGCFSVIKGLDADLLSRKFDFSFIGHYHESRKIRENVFSVGSSNMLNFSEIRQRKGWWLFDSEADPVVRFIENTESPVFRDITLENGDDGSTIAEKFGAESLQWDYFRIKIKGLEIPENINMIKWKRVTLENTSDTKSRADVKFSDSVDTVLKKYISARNVNNLDIETLHEVGRSFL